ncbi:MAG: FAD-binding oxidoreductase [Gammaproteobacteria bacterium]|nr:FAD-binding oxidoreductase [Gammaproteobacteria bacterium]
MTGVTMVANESQAADIIGQLTAAIGSEHVLTSDADRDFYAMDVYNQRELPIAVVQPGSLDEAVEISRIASAAGVALVPRGGGASYTDAYLPATSNSLLVDTSRMNRILEINEEDMYVTVEPGVTWADMTAALNDKGLRTPFWGPFSGLAATVGGSMAQNSVSLGSGTHGISADSVLCFDIVLPGGKVLKTGSAAIGTSTPFFRGYGPDLTGLFTGDAGVLGLKARITFRLIKNPTFKMSCSFGFDDFDKMAAGAAAAARQGVASDNFGLDPKLQQGQLGSQDTSAKMEAAKAVYANSRNPVDGLTKLIKMAIAGERFLKAFPYAMHFNVEAYSKAEAATKLDLIRQACEPHGTEIANTIPTVLMANPFIPLYPILGPRGQRWVPQHGIMAFSKLPAFHAKLHDLYNEYADRMAQHKVEYAAMFTSIGTNGFLYEPVFYWEDDRTAFHKRYLPQEYLDMLPEYAANPEGRALVKEMKARIIDIFHEFGAIHMQIGKSYPYMRGRNEQAAELIQSIKKHVDPDGLMNPGGLGIGE